MGFLWDADSVIRCSRCDVLKKNLKMYSDVFKSVNTKALYWKIWFLSVKIYYQKFSMITKEEVKSFTHTFRIKP